MSYYRLKKVRSTVVITVGGTLAFFGLLATEGNERFYRDIVMPTVRTVLDAEQAHLFAIKMAQYGLTPNFSKKKDDDILSVKVFNREFSNPIGLAAGFDKHAEAMKSLFGFGFGFVEIGSVTPVPQDGNAKPRVFRLVEDKAVINRYGFNSDGHAKVFERIKAFKAQPPSTPNQILGINLGKNKTSSDALADYLSGLKLFAQQADYIVINISSPNTPGLRSLQNKSELEFLLDGLIEERNIIRKDLPIIVKIAPDLTDDELNDIANTLNRKNRVDGIIISNTTITRPDTLKSQFKNETGGLSGEPLKHLSNRAIEKMYRLIDGKIPIIGVGGVSSGFDALEKIKCGSSLVQIYTALTYEGPPLVNRIKKELATLLRDEGFSSVQEAIGYNVKNTK